MVRGRGFFIYGMNKEWSYLIIALSAFGFFLFVTDDSNGISNTVLVSKEIKAIEQSLDSEKENFETQEEENKTKWEKYLDVHDFEKENLLQEGGFAKSASHVQE